MAKRWVRYQMPIMVQVDEDDEVARVVTLPEEIREDRDDRGDFCVYDAAFIRRPDDSRASVHAQQAARPQWDYDHLRAGPPKNWPKTAAWEEGFDFDEDDDRYAEFPVYGRSYGEGQAPHPDDRYEW